MRKIIVLATILFSVFILSGCDEITDEHNKEQKPSIVLHNEGQLTQIYEDGQALEDIVFTIEFKKFTENKINLNDVKINWYINNQVILEHEGKNSITQKVNSPGEITIKVEVEFTLEGKLTKVEDNALISVVKTPTQIVVENDINRGSNKISITVGENTSITFTGTITGNLNHPILKWVILKEISGKDPLVTEIPIEANDLVIEGKKGTATLQYTFESTGNYIVSMQTGEGYLQDANKYLSNTTHVDVNFGAFELSTKNKVAMNSQTGFTDRLLTVNELNKELTGEGVYKWYLNGVEFENDDALTFVHKNTELGGYVYQVKFFPNNDPNNPIETDPLLIVNGVLVSNMTELIAALESKKAGIILSNDMTYNGTNALVINYPMTLYGDGNVLSSKEISTFIKVVSSNVNIANITLDKSQKYSLHIESSLNVYLENIKFNAFGNTNFNEFLSGNFNAGVYVDRSTAAINNIEFLTGALVGIRIDQHSGAGKTILKLYGNLVYNSSDPVLLPVGSGKSHLEGVEFIASGFDYFALPAGEITIRRWDNIGQPISWEIYDPLKVDYKLGEFLDLFHIGISIDISFLMDFDIAGSDGLEFVKMYIRMFNQYGKIEIVNTEDESNILKQYYIVGDTGDQTIYGEDRLIYSLSKDINTTENPVEPIEPKLPNEKGNYKVKIYIGEEFYLGYVIISIK